jgi:neutral trehalase
MAPLQVEDVLFNSILCKANDDLIEIANIVREDADGIRRWNETTRAAINEKLWDEEAGNYYDFDRVAGTLLKDDTIAGFHTLFGKVAPAERSQRLIEAHLLNGGEYWPKEGFAVPTTSMSSAWFNPENYWLGPVWVNTNWMVLHGLEAYGRSDLAGQVRDRTLNLLQTSGFREYFNPLTGQGYGTDSFGWSAALAIDLLEGR